MTCQSSVAIRLRESLSTLCTGSHSFPVVFHAYALAVVNFKLSDSLSSKRYVSDPLPALLTRIYAL